MSNDYEKLRLKNLEDNKRILAEIGLLNPFKPLPRVIKDKAICGNVQSSSKRKQSDGDGVWLPKKKYRVNDGSVKSAAEWPAAAELLPGERRRSQRLQGKEAPDEGEISDEAEQVIDRSPRVVVRLVPKDRPMIYGHIPGVEIGTTWQMRIEVNHAGIHRPTVAGIHPGPEGAYSIALSGGYEDDIDLGECFTYTGEGGRDLKGTKANPKNLRTAAQSKDQTLSRGNQALVRSMETGLPVRVLRGYKLRSPFAPDEGYRYDGLYKVEKWWFTTGMSGFGVYKFALQRIADQPPPPWHFKEEMTDDSNEGDADGDEKPVVDSADSQQQTSADLADTSQVVKDQEQATMDDAVGELASCTTDVNANIETINKADKNVNLPTLNITAA